jgi:threonine-phosphate decarboxylase
MIDGHGDDIFRYGDKIKINFSTNIPQIVDHSGLMKHIANMGDILKNYPEPEPRSVERAIAEKNGIDAENVIVTNGATEAIYLLAHAFARLRSGIIVPTFREYQDACSVFNHTLRFISTLNDIDDNFETVWLCNPNNPTGQVYDRNELLMTIDAHPDSVFIVDQAYAPYSVKEVLTVSDIMQRNNLVVLHSFTKQFVVPGLRIGYAVGPTEIINKLRTLRMPWSVSSIAIEAAHYLMENTKDYHPDRHKLHAEACRIADELRKMGITVCHSDCNFILAQLPHGTAAELKSQLIENYGLLIRDASNFESLTPRHFRIAAQSHDQNNSLLTALSQIQI